MEELMEKVEQWAEDKGIDKTESWQPQFKKIAEEVKEYRDELRKYEDSKGDYVYLVNDEMTEMGDILVTLIVMAQQRGYELYDCLEMAYEKIKNRKGEVIDGTFVKAEDIGKIRKDCRRGDGMKVYNPNDFEYSKEKTSYIKFECMSCNKPVVLLARFSDGYRCRFCNDHIRPVSYVRRKEDIGKIRKDSEDIGKMECSLGG